MGFRSAASERRPCGLEQLEPDVAPLLSVGTPVWVRADNAYYSRDFAEFCRERGWDYSVSVTNPGFKFPVPALADSLPESAWEEVGPCERAVLVRHKPRGWVERLYVVMRKLVEVPKANSFPPARSPSSPEATPPAKLVRRHRCKQGQENAFKGPLRDLDLHHPCRRLLANRIFYACDQLAQMLLCAVQFSLLPKPARRHGLRPLIRHFIRTVTRLWSAPPGADALTSLSPTFDSTGSTRPPFNWSEPSHPLGGGQGAPKRSPPAPPSPCSSSKRRE